MPNIKSLTDREVVDTMIGSSLLAQVRRKIIDGIGAIEQANGQRHKPSTVEIRRMELLLAQEIVTLVRSVSEE